MKKKKYLNHIDFYVEKKVHCEYDEVGTGSGLFVEVGSGPGFSQKSDPVPGELHPDPQPCFQVYLRRRVHRQVARVLGQVLLQVVVGSSQVLKVLLHSTQRFSKLFLLH